MVESVKVYNAFQEAMSYMPISLALLDSALLFSCSSFLDTVEDLFYRCSALAYIDSRRSSKEVGRTINTGVLMGRSIPNNV